MIRSLLYVPGDRPDRVAKALASDADAALVDLEDAVAPAARATARAHLAAPTPDRSGPLLWVRINAGDAGRADLAALAPVADRLAGVVLAMCQDTSWIDEVASSLPSPVTVAPLVETALALRRLDALCGHQRVSQCHLGEIDLLADVGARGRAATDLLGHARAELVVASAAAGLHAPIGGVFADIRDTAGLASDSRHLADLGFAGRPAVHPSQVPVINAAFRPTAGELADARRLVGLYDDALRRGIGTVTDESGTMIDEAVVRRARRLIESDTPTSR